MTSLSRRDRGAIFKKVLRLVETKHFNPKLNGVDWDSIIEARRDRILRVERPEEFEEYGDEAMPYYWGVSPCKAMVPPRFLFHND